MLSVSADEALGSVQLLVDGATEWVQAAGAWNGSHFQLSVPAQGEGGHRVQLRVADAAGNLAPQPCSDFSWVVDTVRFCRFAVFGLVIFQLSPFILNLAWLLAEHLSWFLLYL